MEEALPKPHDHRHTVDDINPALSYRTLDYRNYGICLIMGNAGFISPTVGVVVSVLTRNSFRGQLVPSALVWRMEMVCFACFSSNCEPYSTLNRQKSATKRKHAKGA